MSIKKVSKITYLVSIFLFSIFLFSCGSENSTQNKSVKKKEKVFRASTSMNLDSLDPYRGISDSSEELMKNVFEGLLMPNPDGSLKKAIAEDYSVSEDGLEYTFKIRKGIKFHNGNMLDVKDVEYSLNRMSGKTGDRASKSALENIDTVTVLDNEKIKVTLKKQDATFIYYMIEPIVPDENKDSLDKKAIGTGPYKITSFEMDQYIIMERFDEYWGEKPQIPKICIYIIPNPETMFLKLLSGEIDMMVYVDSKRIKELKNNDIVSGPQNMIQLMALNYEYEPFKDPKVREAINLAVDKKQIIDSVMDGYGTMIDTHMSPVMKQYYIEMLDTKVDIEKAKQLLAEAHQEKLEFTIKIPNNYAVHINTAQIIAEQLKKIGITVKIQTVEWSSWLSEVYTNRNYQATIIGIGGKLEPNSILERYTSDYNRNFFNYKNKEYDDLIAKAKITQDEKERALIYKEALRILRHDNAAIYIMDPNMIIAFKKGIKGHVFYPLPFIDFSKMTTND